MSNNNSIYARGFTIVELLVVIVVIGILAAITIISYTGISQRASVATIQSDLKSAATQLGIDNVNDGSYPLSKEAANNNNGLATSPGTVLTYIQSSGGTGYCLSATSEAAGTTYHISTGGAIETGGCTLTWSQISSGMWTTCGIASDNNAYCWGWNNYGKLGNDSTIDSHIPVAVSTAGVLNGKTVESIATGQMHTCAVASDNLGYCWGYNGNSQIGNGSAPQTNQTPIAIDISGLMSGKTFSNVVTGQIHGCTIASDNNAYCWGDGAYGEMGNDTLSNNTTPGPVSTAGVLIGKTIKAIAAGSYRTCAIASDDNAYCWGWNDHGGLGNNSNSPLYVGSPVAVNTDGVLSGKTVKSISTGNRHSCAIASDDNAYCWGYASSGQLGNSSTTESFVPVAVNTSGALSGKTLLSLSVSGDSSCAIASDNKAYCWGNLASNSSIPVAVSTAGVLNGKTLTSISVSPTHACVIDSNGSVYCWGDNSHGGLGNDSTTYSAVPVAVVPVSL